MTANAQDRCQKQIGGGSQCDRKAVYAGVCDLHGAKEAKNRMDKRMYNLACAESQELYNQFASSEHLRTVREELSLYRMYFKRLADQMPQDVDNFLRYPMLDKMVNTIKALVESVNKTEVALGVLLDQERTAAIMADTVKIVAEVFNDVPNLGARMEEIGRRLKEVASQKPLQGENDG